MNVARKNCDVDSRLLLVLVIPCLYLLLLHSQSTLTLDHPPPTPAPLRNLIYTHSHTLTATTENQRRGKRSTLIVIPLFGLLQYFSLVEGCITMIKTYQNENNFTYDWIIRTRVDGYWSDSLDPEYFKPGQYLVPPGSSYGGLNDRFGVGDLNTSTMALSRLSLIPDLDSAGFTSLNSESAFKAQLSTHRVPYVTKPVPFCIMTDRTYDFPPESYGVPVASLSSRGPLNGAKCRPCTGACSGSCVAEAMVKLDRGWSWTEWENGTLKLCDARGEWEKIFDGVAGEKLARARQRVGCLEPRRCVGEFEEMRGMAVKWDAPASDQICVLGLKPK